MLNLLPQLAGSVLVPPAVAQEIMVGRRAGVSLPELTSLVWLEVRHPQRKQEGQWLSDLGPGEAEVLMLGLELDQSIVVLDDALARRVAEALGLKLTGTLGILLDAKRAGYIAAVGPYSINLTNCGSGSPANSPRGARTRGRGCLESKSAIRNSQSEIF